MDDATLAALIRFADRAIDWARAEGASWIENEQVRAAVAMYVGQVGEIINREVTPDELAANPELFGALGGFRNRIYHHYYRDFRLDVLRDTVDVELPAKLALWKARQAATPQP